MKKSLRQRALDNNLSPRKVQRWRKVAGVGEITSAGYMLTDAEWTELLSVMPVADGRFGKKFAHKSD